MSKKSVSVSITSHTLSREENGVTFLIFVDTSGRRSAKSRFGELVVSKGGIRWRPKNKQDHHFMNWNLLDQKMRKCPKR